MLSHVSKETKNENEIQKQFANWLWSICNTFKYFIQILVALYILQKNKEKIHTKDIEIPIKLPSTLCES